MAREIGVVKFWREDKGWGYISKKNSRGDIFVHYREVEGEAYHRNLVAGETVEFEEATTEYGRQAKEVRRVLHP